MESIVPAATGDWRQDVQAIKDALTRAAGRQTREAPPAG